MPDTSCRNPGFEAYLERDAVNARMQLIKHKILVLSGKGGVGKSTVAVNLAASLAFAGKQVGILDIDIHGPSIPKLLNVEGNLSGNEDSALLPVSVNGNLKAMSIGFLLRNNDEAVIWRGPMKMGLIKQFLKDVAWGNLDYLIIDSPPGTGDEPLSACQLIENPDGAIIVTTPQEMSIIDVRKCVSFCKELNINILGVIENMSGFVCPECGKRTDIFKKDGGKEMAAQLGIPFLGCIPLDPDISEASDNGTPFLDKYSGTETAKSFDLAIRPVLEIENS